MSPDPSLAEFRTSDGLVAQRSSEEVIAERATSYREWLERVTPERPVGHEFVPTPAEPLHFSRLDKPLEECTVALVSTGGVHLKSQEPFEVYGWEGDWSSRSIPGDVDSGELTVTHTHYATQDALEDPNVMLPIDRLRELADEGVIGAVAPRHAGFMGFIPDPAQLVDETAPAVAEQLHECSVDLVLLTAG